MLKMSSISVYTSLQMLPEIHDDLQIASCSNSSQIFTCMTSVPGCSLAADLFTKQNDVIVMLLLSWYSAAFSICKQDFDR